MNIGAARRNTSGRKQLPAFKQGRVNARKYLAEQNRMISVSSRRLQRKLNTSFRKDLSIILNELASGEQPNEAASIRRKTIEIEAAVKSEIKKLFTTLVEVNDSRYKPVLSKAVTDLGFGFNRPFAIENWVDQYFSDREVLFTNMSERMTRRILNSVEIDQLEGLGVAQINRNIRERFYGTAKNQAALIARTETHNAAGYAQNAYHSDLSKDLGITMQKQWVATLDARTRSAHAIMNGVQVGMDEDFNMPNGTKMAYTGDSRGGASNVINCRCAIVYIDSDDDVEDEKIPDIDTSSGVRLRADGRPLGLANFEMEKKYGALGAGDKSLEALKARDNIRETIRSNSDAWPEKVKGARRFRGRTLGDYGSLERSVLEGRSEASFMVNEILQELNSLSDLLKVPKLRGIKSISGGTSAANMGDGVMGINLNYIDKINDRGFGLKQASASKWKLGDEKSSRPFTAEAFEDNWVDDLRSTMYHEFGHLVHQTHRALNSSYYNPPVERWMVRKRLKGTAATRYADTNGREWFAENFALWAKGRDELVSPRFVKLIDTIKIQGDIDGV